MGKEMMWPRFANMCVRACLCADDVEVVFVVVCKLEASAVSEEQTG